MLVSVSDRGAVWPAVPTRPFPSEALAAKLEGATFLPDQALRGSFS